MASILAGLRLLDCLGQRKRQTTLGASSAWDRMFLMQSNEQLVHRCMMQAELEGLQGNAHLADLLQQIVTALSEAPEQ
jgi:hypothetical protein